MPEINLSDSRGRDAIVAARSAAAPPRLRRLDAEGRQVQSRRVVKATLDREHEALLAANGGDPAKLSAALIAGDPELDLELCGLFLTEAPRVHVDPDRHIVHHVTKWEVVRLPDGTIKERRPRRTPEPNVALELPLKWTGRLIPKAEAVRKFVFASTMQIEHVNGLTFDFLFGMAKELAEKDSLMLVGAGPKGNQPLIFQRNGNSYRGFLEGRVAGDRYALILHLSNLEMKAPKELPQGGAPSEARPEASAPAPDAS